MAAPLHPRVARVLALALAIAALAARPGAAEPTGAVPLAPASPNAFASPLVTIERIDAGALTRPGLPAPGEATGPEGQPPPIYLLDPEGFTAIGQVGPPDGGNLIMLVE